jgi:SPP1 family predicted phage head-tail adaptor
MARIPAGARNRKVQFYPRNQTEDALGVEIEADGTPIVMWAAVSFGSGADRREAGQAGSDQTATFRVLSCAALREADERWQIEWNGARWGISSIVPIDNDATEIEFTALRKGA